MFVSIDIGDDPFERDSFEIVQGRYGGAIRSFSSGVGEGRSAATWDLRKRRRLHDTSGCDRFDNGVFSGAYEAVFLPYGGLFYRCDELRVADRYGDRQLEPSGTAVRQLAVSSSAYGNARLYWLVESEAGALAKSLELGY